MAGIARVPDRALGPVLGTDTEGASFAALGISSHLGSVVVAKPNEISLLQLLEGADQDPYKEQALIRRVESLVQEYEQLDPASKFQFSRCHDIATQFHFVAENEIAVEHIVGLAIRLAREYEMVPLTDTECFGRLSRQLGLLSQKGLGFLALDQLYQSLESRLEDKGAGSATKLGVMAVREYWGLSESRAGDRLDRLSRYLLDNISNPNLRACVVRLKRCLVSRLEKLYILGTESDFRATLLKLNRLGVSSEPSVMTELREAGDRVMAMSTARQSAAEADRMQRCRELFVELLGSSISS